jgi:hypothetical protein
MKYAVCRLIWESRGYSYKSVSAALQREFPGRKGLAVSSLQRYVKLGDQAPPDVVEAIRSLPVEPDAAPEGAEVVQLGLDALERGPVVDPVALAAALQTKLPTIDPEVIAAVVTTRLCGSDQLAKKVAAEVSAQQPDAFEIAWKAAAEALAQEPKPPSADEVAAKVEATLAKQPKKIARYVARYLRRQGQAPKLDEEKLAAVVVRQLAPWLGVGFAGLVAVAWLILSPQHEKDHSTPDGRVTVGDYERGGRGAVALGQNRLPLWDWQDRPPCREVAQELDGGCWIQTAHTPPCPKDSWEKNGKCWVPAAGRDRKPPQAGKDGPEVPPPAQDPR